MKVNPRSKVLVKRLSLFVSLVTCIFWLWVAYGGVFLGWTAYLERDSGSRGAYRAVLNGTHVADLEGVPLQSFIVTSRWMALGATLVLLFCWIYAYCVRVSKKNSLEMNLLGDHSVVDFLSSISKIFALLMAAMAVTGLSIIATWLVMLKGSAFTPGRYTASAPWDSVGGETYQGLALPPSCPTPRVKLGVHLIGNNPFLWPPTSCSTSYEDPVTTYFCCFAIEEESKPRMSHHYYSYTLLGGIGWVALIVVFTLGFTCSTWWKRQAVGAI